MADNVAQLRHVLTLVTEPTLVVGHSYGCRVMTALGPGAPNVVGLVYVAGFGLDEGESLAALLGQGPPTPAIAAFQVDDQGFAWLPEDAFPQHFAPDIDPVEARVMCAVQQPLAVSTLDDVMTEPAWRTLPTWFAVAQHDHVIPPDAERQFAQRMGAMNVDRGWVAADHHDSDASRTTGSRHRAVKLDAAGRDHTRSTPSRAVPEVTSHVTATGAASSTRRALTATTAGGLALLGAVLGIAGAYVVLTAGHADELDDMRRSSRCGWRPSPSGRRSSRRSPAGCSPAGNRPPSSAGQSTDGEPGTVRVDPRG